MQFVGLSELTLPNRTRTLLVCLSVFLILCSFSPAHSQTTNRGINIELPVNGQLRLENQFGDINIVITHERNLVLEATVDPAGAATSRSPVLLESKRGFLSVSVINPGAGSTARVNLTVQVPDTARAEIITSDGRIATRGLSNSMSLTTVSGSVLAELDQPLDVDVSARSTTGVVRTELTSGNVDEHSFQYRFGQGRKTLRVNSQRGEIVLSGPATAAVDSAGTAPVLKQAPEKAGAGTPATNGSEEVDEGDVIRVDAQLVTLNLSVVDRSTSRGVLGLTQPDFRLFENGVEQHLLQFDSSSAPFDLVLLIDLSGSTRDVVKLIRSAARRFVDAARPSDRISIITFAGRTTLVSPLTLDREALRERFSAIDTVPGDTKLYDAVDSTMTEVAKQTKNSRRAAIVLMSDGLDGSMPGVQGDGSKLAYKELLNNVREFDGVLYSLWLNTYYEALNPQDTQPEAFDMGYDRMKELADTGGGLFYEVESLEDLAGVYERVVADLGTVYSLAYRPIDKSRDGKWRTIKVTVNRTNAVARGKHGYFAN